MIQAIIFILFIALGIGFPLTLWIAPKHNVAGRIGLSYLLGIGIYTLIIFGTNLVGVKLTFINNIFTFLVFSLPLIFFQRSKIKNFISELNRSLKNHRLEPLEKITLGAIGFFIISGFVNTLYWPVYIWDSLTLYDFRAHVFAQIGFINKALNDSYMYGYPLLTSLSHTVVYIAGGNNPQFIYSLFYLSLALVFFGLLREFCSRKLSMFFTLILITIPSIFSQSTIAYTNLPYVIYFSLGAIYFYIWNKKNTPGFLILSAVMVGLATWTRSGDSFWLPMFGIVLLTASYKKRFLDAIIFSLFLFPIQQIWQLFQSSAQSTVESAAGEITGSLPVLTNIFNFYRWAEVINFIYKNVVVSWGPIFILFLTAFALSFTDKKVKKFLLFLFIIFTFLGFFMLGTFVFSFTFKQWSEIPDSAYRLSMIFYPLFVYFTALVTSELYENKQ